MALKSRLFSWASSIARKRDELAKLRAERVKKLDEAYLRADKERLRLNSIEFPTPRKRDELAAYLRADKELLRLNSIVLNDDKVDYKTYLVAGVWTVVSRAISIPVVYLFGKFLDYKFPVVEEEY